MWCCETEAHMWSGGYERVSVLRGHMPRGPNVAISLRIVSNAKQDILLLHVCMSPPFVTPCPSFGPAC